MSTGDRCLWTMPIGIGDAGPVTLDGVDAVELAELLASRPTLSAGAAPTSSGANSPPTFGDGPAISTPSWGEPATLLPEAPSTVLDGLPPPEDHRRRSATGDARWSQGRGNGVVPSPWQTTGSHSIHK
jgi:hypothetical protein